MNANQTQVKTWAIVPASGKGLRMGADRPKQYIDIAGKTLIEHTLSTLLSLEAISQCLVLTSVSDIYWSALNISKHPKILTLNGGLERMDTVHQGLEALSGKANDLDWVMVHDAARPLLKKSDIENLFQAIDGHPIGGLLGIPVRDTLKKVEENHDKAADVMETVDRAQLWQALTPQVFRYGPLKAAYEEAIRNKKLVTDESQAIELTGGRPKIVACEHINLKLTLAQDLEIFQCLLS